MREPGLARRFGAMLYDSVLVIALMALVTSITVMLRGEPIESGNVLFQLLLLATAYFFYVGFWSYYGRTLGMQSWRMRVETLDGNAPDLAQASLRFFAAILSLLPLGLGYWWALWDKNRLTWHDRLSGTRLRYLPKKNQ